jgi:peptide deformylase
MNRTTAIDRVAISAEDLLGTGYDPLRIQARDAVAKFDIPFDPDWLNTKSELFNFQQPSRDPIQFARDLVETMVANGGLGLAAPQVGVFERVIAVRGEPMLVMFNPKIVSEEGSIQLEEGCLSYRGVYIKVARAAAIKVRYTLPNGEVETKRFEGLSARIIQHEIDHLDGVTMFDRAHPFHREQGLRKLKQAKRKKSK